MNVKISRPALWRNSVLVGICVLAIAGLAPAAAPPSGEGALAFGVVRQLRYNVADFRDAQGKHWIHMSSAFESLYPNDMEQVIATLWDFQSAPRIFSRVESVRLRSDTGTEAVAEQRMVVRILGVTFDSNLVYGYALMRPSAKKATVSFEMIETDGSCLDSKGSWELVDRSSPAGASTYARYAGESDVDPRLPAQAVFMRGFGAADIKKTMLELGQAMTRK